MTARGSVHLGVACAHAQQSDRALCVRKTSMRVQLRYYKTVVVFVVGRVVVRNMVVLRNRVADVMMQQRCDKKNDIQLITTPK